MPAGRHAQRRLQAPQHHAAAAARLTARPQLQPGAGAGAAGVRPPCLPRAGEVNDPAEIVRMAMGCASAHAACCLQPHNTHARAAAAGGCRCTPAPAPDAPCVRALHRCAHPDYRYAKKLVRLLRCAAAAAGSVWIERSRKYTVLRQTTLSDRIHVRKRTLKAHNQHCARDRGPNAACTASDWSLDHCQSAANRDTAQPARMNAASALREFPIVKCCI